MSAMQKKPAPASIPRNVWLLRQSRRFPGEYYCFNTANGEAMWCRSEDRPSFAKPYDSGPTNLMEDTHSYPEPQSPPHDYNGPNTTKTTSKPNVPTFGTVTFPTYLPQGNNIQQVYTNVPNNQKVFLAPAIPMFIPNYPNLNRVDRITQTSRDNSPVFVETTQVPISRRLNGHFDISRTVSLRNDQNSNLRQSNKAGFTPIAPANFVLMKKVAVDVDRPMPKKRTLSEDSEISKKHDEPKEMFVRKRRVSYTQSSSSGAVEIDKDVQASSPNPTNKDTISKSTTKAQSDEATDTAITPRAQSPEETFVPNLAEDDLRYKLLAKRRKTVETSTHTVKEKESTDAKDQAETLNPAETPVKKKVSFDFNTAQTGPFVSCDEFYEDREGTYAKLPASSESPHTGYNTAKLRSLTGNHAAGKCWYIAADVDVLLHKFGFIENLVLADQHCRLVVPSAVRSQLARLCRRSAAPQSRVLAARRLSRRLATAEFVVHDEKQSCLNGADGIIECCKRYQVILITNQTALHTKASSSQITCLTLEQAEKMATEAKPLHFETKKIQITLNNLTVTKEDTNIFLQNGILAMNKQKSFTKEIQFKETPPLQLTNIQQTEKRDTTDISRQDTPSSLTITSDTPTHSSETNWGIEDLDLRDKSPILSQKVSSKGPIRNELRNSVQRWNQASSPEKTAQEFENELLRFGVVDQIVEEKLMSRREEWLCRFVQILEEALAGVVCSNSESTTDLPTPLLLDEALTAVSQLHSGFGDRAATTLRLACDQVAALFVHPTRQGDFVQIKRDVDSKELIRILGAGVILIKCLIQLHPASEALSAALERLNQLLQDTLDPGSTPDVSISDFKGKVPYNSLPEDVSVEDRLKVTKKPSEVMEYLKRHFPAWQEYERQASERTKQFVTLVEDLVINEEETGQSNVRVIRTCGRDLGRLRLKPHTITLEAGAGQRDDFTSDSGICQSDESQHVKPLINTFLGEISDFFILVCDIVKSTVLEFEEALLQEKRKRVISRKVKKIQRVIVENREKLQSIIRREVSNSESTLKMLITKAGVSTSNIKMSRYRQVIMKLLEQADILDGSLQTIAQLTKGDKVDLKMLEKVCDIKYLNIFDALSNC